MHYKRPIVMSIAGLDPSGGAGILADIKTLEQLRCIGFGVATAWTVQTEKSFLNIDWLPLEKIKEQARPLLAQYRVQVIKIGIIENLEILWSLVTWLKEINKEVLIVWDTVLSASTGFSLTNATNKELLKSILRRVFLITPNIREAQWLGSGKDAQQAAQYLSDYCNVLLKGGHTEIHVGVDTLWTGQQAIQFFPSAKTLSPKHGSGCILSSAIAAHLAQGMPLEQSCEKAKAYIETILGSNQNLLAYHHV